MLVLSEKLLFAFIILSVFHEKLPGNGYKLSDFVKNCSGTGYNYQIL